VKSQAVVLSASQFVPEEVSSMV